MARKNRRLIPEPAAQGSARNPPVIEGGFEVRSVQPYEATKRYVCPGCQGPILPGVAHIVAVPPESPDLRRHWHTPCWRSRATRRPGR